MAGGEGTEIIALLYLIATLLLGNAQATAPWFGRDKLVEITPRTSYQHYSKIETGEGVVDQEGANAFSCVDISIASDNKYDLLVKTLFSETNEHTFTLESLYSSIRRQWSSDIIGDPFTVVTGINLTLPTSSALRDYNTIYCGKLELEALAIVGRESSCGPFWSSRWWALIALGQADRGYPWIRADAAFEKNFTDRHQWKIFVKAARGLGKESLSLSSFSGYGKIGYCTVDTGVAYSYQEGRVAVEYLLRAWGENTLLQAQSITLSIFLPFSL